MKFTDGETTKMRQCDVDPDDFVVVPREAMLVTGAVFPNGSPEMGIRAPCLMLSFVVPVLLSDVSMPRVLTEKNVVNPLDGMIPVCELRLVVPKKRLTEAALASLAVLDAAAEATESGVPLMPASRLCLPGNEEN